MSRARTTIEASIPSEYNVPGTALFSPKWFSAITKKDRFWTDLNKHMSAAIKAKRLSVFCGVTIKTDVETVARSRAQKREEKKAMSRTISRSAPAQTPEAGDENTSVVDADLVGEARELADSNAEDEDEVRPLSKRPRRTASQLPIKKVEYGLCNHFDILENMEINNDGAICLRCRIDEGDPPSETAAVDVPLSPVPPIQPKEHLEETPTIQSRPTAVKVEEDINPEKIDELTITVSTSGRKRAREDTAKEVTIKGQDYLVLIGADGTAQKFRLEGHPDKRVNVEAEN
ncbi:hypothetical protein H2200_000338 [Cladophialophora chaetospira]|uniref:Uncharacterized protein n=1 Tax=Cladophialophora chaetospira TaxID=386627 RepID=A0AA38XPA1_9EURO|nr:hypothetical protein H2200_000338 [Cladophialophora chaetospira]